MKKSFLVLLVVLVMRPLGYGFERHFRLVRTIGDDRENYMFQRLSGAALTENKEIIVCDQLGNFVAKYDWRGIFIKSIGRKGKGPGDFLMPTYIRVYKQKIYLLDHFNARFAEMDLDLENLQYFKLNRSIYLREFFDVLNDTSFLATSMNCVSDPQIEGVGKILQYEKVKGLRRVFFDRYPTDQLVDYAKDKGFAQKMDLFGGVIWGLNDSHDKILVSYVHPDNPIAFYLFSTKGKQLLEFEYEIEKKYRFPMHWIKAKKISLDLLNKTHLVNIRGIVYYANNWYVFFETIYYRSQKDYDGQYFCLKFSSNGTFEEQFRLKGGFVPFSITKDGYLLGKRSEAETEKLSIYQIVE